MGNFYINYKVEKINRKTNYVEVICGKSKIKKINKNVFILINS